MTKWAAGDKIIALVNKDKEKEGYNRTKKSVREGASSTDDSNSLTAREGEIFLEKVILCFAWILFSAQNDIHSVHFEGAL